MGQDSKRRALNTTFALGNVPTLALGNVPLLHPLFFVWYSIISFTNNASEQFLGGVVREFLLHICLHDSHGSEKDPSAWKMLPPLPKTFT